MLRRQAARDGRGNHAVGIGRIADHGHPAIVGGNPIDNLALLDENPAVVFKQLGALHSRPARLGTDEQAPIGILEADVGVAGEGHTGQKRERTVVQLHRDAFERLHGLLDGDFDELQVNGLVRAEHLAGGDAEDQGITDLASGTGDGDANRLSVHTAVSFQTKS